MKHLLMLLFSLRLIAAPAQTTVSLKPGSNGIDAVVSSLQPMQNYGSSAELNALAWTNAGNPVVLRSLLKFDLSMIPPGSEIISAYLNLYNNPNSSNNNGTHASLSGPNSAYVRRITSPWDESLVTWTNMPALSPLNKAVLNASTSPQQNFLNIDVKDMLQDMVNFPQNNFGFCLHLQTEQSFRCLLFASSDHPDPALHPELVITYLPSAYNCSFIKFNSESLDDAVVSSLAGENNLNFGNAFEFNALAWTNSSNPVNHRNLFYFNLPMLPQNSFIHSAKLNFFYCSSSNSNGPHSILNGTNESYIYKLLGPWQESTVTWNTQPTYANSPSAYLPISIFSNDNYFGIDITAIYNDLMNNPASNFGMILKLGNESYYRRLVFSSTDHPNQQLSPELELTFTTSTGLAPSATQYQLNIFPNPASGGIINIIPPSAHTENVIIRIFNAQGQLLLNRSCTTVNSTAISLDISEILPAGALYAVQIETDTNIYVSKLLVQP